LTSRGTLVDKTSPRSSKYKPNFSEPAGNPDPPFC
jgi:hypothetical protein